LLPFWRDCLRQSGAIASTRGRRYHSGQRCDRQDLGLGAFAGDGLATASSPRRWAARTLPRKTTAQIFGALTSTAPTCAAQIFSARTSATRTFSGADLSEANLQRASFSNKSELKLARIFDPQRWGAKGAICSKAYVKSPKLRTPTGKKAPSDPKESANCGQCEASSALRGLRSASTVSSLPIYIVGNATADQREIADAVVRNWILNDPNSRDFSSRLAHGLLGCMKDLSQNGVCAGRN